MIAKILPLLNRLIPSDLAKKALEKKIPGLSKFFAGTAGAGYSLDSALDYIREQFEEIPEKGLRPDQAAAMKRVQQGAVAGKAISKIPKAAMGAATAGLAGAAVGAIPEVIGSLFQQPQGQKAGREPSELSRESLTQQFEEAKKNQSLKQIAPDIAQEIEFDLSNGLSLDNAIENIKGQPQIHGKHVSNLERNLKMPFSAIVKQFYSGNQTQQPQQQAQSISQLQNQDPQGLQNLGKMGGLGSGIADTMYQQMMESLRKGTTIMGGIDDPFLKVAKPFYDKGMIKSIDDLKRLSKQYMQQKQQGQQPGQGKQVLAQTMQQITEALRKWKAQGG